jgi:uncharacterized membrane protein
MPAFGRHGNGGMMMNGRYSGGNPDTDYHVAFGEILIFMFLVILLIISSIYNFIKYRPQSLEILKQRLAKGEISKEEFENLKQEIRKE